jgi:hypothetical protein
MKYKKYIRRTKKYLSSSGSIIYRSAKKGFKKTGRVLKSEGRRAGRFIAKSSRKYTPVTARAIRDYAYEAKKEHARFATPEDIYFGRATFKERERPMKGSMKKKKHKVKVKYVYVMPEERKEKRKKKRNVIRYVPSKVHKHKKRRSSHGGNGGGYFDSLPRNIATGLG